MVTMRAPVLLFGLGVMSCASPAPRASEAPVAVALPAPPSGGATPTQAARPRSLVVDGEYSLALNESSHHGCSRSWGSSSSATTALLRIDHGRVALSYKAVAHSSFGSHGSPPQQSSTTWSAELVGEISERTGNLARASLTFTSCEGACSEGPIEIECRFEKLQLDAAGSSPEPGAGGSLAGLRCKGLSSFIPGGREVAELPFAPGAGVELQVNDASARLVRPRSGAGG